MKPYPSSAATHRASSHNSQTLNQQVKKTIESYLAELEGEPPSHLYQLVLKQVEPALLEVVMNYSEGKVSRAAKILGIDRGTLSKKLDRYDIDAKALRYGSNGDDGA